MLHLANLCNWDIASHVWTHQRQLATLCERLRVSSTLRNSANYSIVDADTFDDRWLLLFSLFRRCTWISFAYNRSNWRSLFAFRLNNSFFFLHTLQITLIVCTPHWIYIYIYIYILCNFQWRVNTYEITRKRFYTTRHTAIWTSTIWQGNQKEKIEIKERVYIALIVSNNFNDVIWTSTTIVPLIIQIDVISRQGCTRAKCNTYKYLYDESPRRAL